LGIAYNGMTMVGVEYKWREVITGSILIIALAISSSKKGT